MVAHHAHNFLFHNIEFFIVPDSIIASASASCKFARRLKASATLTGSFKVALFSINSFLNTPPKACFKNFHALQSLLAPLASHFSLASHAAALLSLALELAAPSDFCFSARSELNIFLISAAAPFRAFSFSNASSNYFIIILFRKHIISLHNFVNPCHLRF